MEKGSMGWKSLDTLFSEDPGIETLKHLLYSSCMSLCIPAAFSDPLEVEWQTQFVLLEKRTSTTARLEPLWPSGKSRGEPRSVTAVFSWVSHLCCLIDQDYSLQVRNSVERKKNVQRWLKVFTWTLEETILLFKNAYTAAAWQRKKLNYSPAEHML